MRLYVTVHGQPAIIVGYAPGRTAPKAIVLGLAPHPISVELQDCIFPKLPRKLERRIRAWAKRETQAAQSDVANLAVN